MIAVTEKERNDLAKQYEPLVNKLTKQYASKVKIEWNQVKSMAYEGLVIAMNTYDSNRSSMTFMQFAAFAIRNNILSRLDDELRTVKMSSYAQKKAKERGDAVFNTISIDHTVTGSEDSDNIKTRETVMGLAEKAKFDDGDVYEYLYSRIDEEFPERDRNIFYKSFGLKGFEEMKGKDIAKEYGISEGLVSQKIKKIVLHIRKDEEICEILGNLL
jgi:RNA polymerase sigma factor (sigma-70 family)